jgi:hypothetical protein
MVWAEVTAHPGTVSRALDLPQLSKANLPQERYRDQAQCLVWCDNVQIILSRQPPTLLFMRRIVDELHRLAESSGHPTGALLIIRSDCPPPTEEARKFIQNELGRARMVAAAQVVTGSGFHGAAMRAALSMIQLVTRPKYPMKVFADVTGGASWLTNELVGRVGHAPSATKLAAIAGDAYSRFLGNSRVIVRTTRSSAPPPALG